MALQISLSEAILELIFAGGAVNAVAWSFLLTSAVFVCVLIGLRQDKALISALLRAQVSTCVLIGVLRLLTFVGHGGHQLPAAELQAWAFASFVGFAFCLGYLALALLALRWRFRETQPDASPSEHGVGAALLDLSALTVFVFAAFWFV